MEIIKTVLCQAIDINISYVILLDLVVAMLHLINIGLGTILGAKEDKFDIKKFFFGILKAVLLMLIIIGLCYVLNVFVIVINLLEDLEISTSMVTTLEIIAVMVSVIVDLAKEITEKLKSFKSLKYGSYDDIVLNDTNIIEPTDFKG